MFLNKDELYLSKEFLTKGYIVKDVADINSLNYIKKIILKNSNNYLNKKKTEFANNWFDQSHNDISIENLNEFRMNIFKRMNSDKKFRYNYYQMAKPYLDILVGNEIAMQNNVNLSIQIPNDKSSLLPVHSDTWSGDSPYEVVVWLPLVDCYKTKSMFILNPKKSKKIYKNFNFSKSGSKLFNKIKNDIEWINIKFGQILIFNQSLPHGNVVNKQKETRWSLNCRFKSLFSPYGDKKIGEFFEPITLRAATKIGLEYEEPKK